MIFLFVLFVLAVIILASCVKVSLRQKRTLLNGLGHTRLHGVSDSGSSCRSSTRLRGKSI